MDHAHAAAGRSLQEGGASDDPGEDGLSRRDREILSFERQWWKYAGAKEQAIRELFDMSTTRYYQVLNALIDTSGRARRRPDAGQAAAPAACQPPATALGPSARNRGLNTEQRPPRGRIARQQTRRPPVPAAVVGPAGARSDRGAAAAPSDVDTEPTGRRAAR